MSLNTWEKEFYNVKLNTENVSKMTMLDCIEHSLKKWKGLTRDNCRKHKVTFYKVGMVLREEGETPKLHSISAADCALCQKSFELTINTLSSPCLECAIYMTNGKGVCSKVYSKIMSGKPVSLMINLLKKTLKEWKKRCKN